MEAEAGSASHLTQQAGSRGWGWLSPSTVVVLPLLIDPRVLQVPCLPLNDLTAPPPPRPDKRFQNFYFEQQSFVD